MTIPGIDQYGLTDNMRATVESLLVRVHRLEDELKAERVVRSTIELRLRNLQHKHRVATHEARRYRPQRRLSVVA